MAHFSPCTARMRLRFTRFQHVDAPPEAVFPLLCPVREYDWIPGWDCELIYTASGVAEAGCVFQTDRSTDGGLDTWVVSRYEPPTHIGFVRINHLRAMQYDIHLTGQSDGSTVLEWTQLTTALNEAGDRHLTVAWEAEFSEAIARLETLLNQYLQQAKAPG